MQADMAMQEKECTVAIDATTVEEYASQAKLLQEFVNLPSINKAWILKSENGVPLWIS